MMRKNKQLTGAFYLKLPTFRDNDEWLEMGEMSFGNFYSYGGTQSLNNFLRMAEKKPDAMNKIQIKDDKNNSYTAEEFVLLLPSTDISTAIEMAEKLRQLTEQYNFSDVKNITASFGVTQFMKTDNETRFISRADEALYKAKENGRNNVETLPPLQLPLHFVQTDQTIEKISS